MPDAKSGRFYIVHEFQVAGKLSVKVAGNHLLLSVTGRSQRCRSGSEISGAGLYERQGAKGRCRSVEGGWLFNGLKKRSFMSIPSPDPAKYPLCVYFLLG